MPIQPIAHRENPILQIIEEFTKFLLTPFNWFLLLFAYIGAFFARILDPEQDGVEETELLVTNVLFFGTVGWIVVLLINFVGFAILSSGIDFFNVLIFFAGGFFCAVIPALRDNGSKSKKVRARQR